MYRYDSKERYEFGTNLLKISGDSDIPHPFKFQYDPHTELRLSFTYIL